MPDKLDIDATPTGEIRVPCEVYSRIVGYLRPVSAWNEGKRQEYADRVTFEVPRE